MEHSDFNKMAHELVNKHLTNWQIAYNRRKKGLGLCSFRTKTLEFSEYFVAVCTEEEAYDTITHEIAHALLPPQEGHNWRWRMKHRELGGNAKRTCDGLAHDEAHKDLTQPKYWAVCDSCGKKTPLYRKTKKTRSCGQCCPRYFNRDYLLRIVQNY